MYSSWLEVIFISYLTWTRLRTAECQSSCAYHVNYMIIKFYTDWLQIVCRSGAVARLDLSATVSAVTGICFPRQDFWEGATLLVICFWHTYLSGMYTLYICFSEGDIQTRLYFLVLYQGTVVWAFVLFVGIYWACGPESIRGSCQTQKLVIIVAFDVIAKGVNISVAASGAPSCLILVFTQISSSRRIPTVQRCWRICTDEERCYEALHGVLTALSTVNRWYRWVIINIREMWIWLVAGIIVGGAGGATGTGGCGHWRSCCHCYTGDKVMCIFRRWLHQECVGRFSLWAMEAAVVGKEWQRARPQWQKHYRWIFGSSVSEFGIIRISENFG